jgi:hypothetical protein
LTVDPEATVAVKEVVITVPPFTCMPGTMGVGVQPLAVTVRAIDVDAVRAPEVPVIVTVAAPSVAEALAARVSGLELVVGLVPNVAVTPLGKPDAVRVTAPVNPPAAATATVPAPLDP